MAIAIDPGSPMTQQSVRDFIQEQIKAQQLDQLIVGTKHITLSFDDDYIEAILRKVNKRQLLALIERLESNKLLAEKILFDKS